jgi:hypothetical protein
MEDKENGQIIGKGNMQYTSDIFVGSEGTKGWIRYKVKIVVKQGRYKYEITDFIHEGNPYNPGGQFSFGLITNSVPCPYKFKWSTKKWGDKVWLDIKETIAAKAPSMIESLKKAMSHASVSGSNDW